MIHKGNTCTMGLPSGVYKSVLWLACKGCVHACTWTSSVVLEQHAYHGIVFLCIKKACWGFELFTTSSKTVSATMLRVYVLRVVLSARLRVETVSLQ
jgi:hypothetical protein